MCACPEGGGGFAPPYSRLGLDQLCTHCRKLKECRDPVTLNSCSQGHAAGHRVLTRLVLTVTNVHVSTGRAFLEAVGDNGEGLIIVKGDWSSLQQAGRFLNRYTQYDTTSYKELNMNQSQTKQGHYHTLKHASRLANTHHFARLMSPAEVEIGTADSPEFTRERTRGHWVLCWDVSSEMYQELKTDSSPGSFVRITGFASPGGFNYWVMTHQAKTHQHRFILSLVDPNVKALLDCITTSGVLSFSMGNDGGDDALILGHPFAPEVFVPLLRMCD